jgi:hypothetical protein
MGAGGSVVDGLLESESKSKPELVETRRTSHSRELPPQNTFHVQLINWVDAPSNMPKDFKMLIGSESLDFLDKDSSHPIFQFPYHNAVNL